MAGLTHNNSRERVICHNLAGPQSHILIYKHVDQTKASISKLFDFINIIIIYLYSPTWPCCTISTSDTPKAVFSDYKIMFHNWIVFFSSSSSNDWIMCNETQYNVHDFV
jgi:hypothetical protein